MRASDQSYLRFLASVGANAGLADSEESEATARSVVCVLLEFLPRPLRHALKEMLPATLLEGGSAASLARSPAIEGQMQEDFVQAVANTEELPLGFAREHVLVVCQALVELLPAELVQRIRQALGEDLGLMFRHREHLARPPKESRDMRRTISVGRPGGLHPLSEAAPSEDEESIASGRPGGRRPLSEAHPGVLKEPRK